MGDPTQSSLFPPPPFAPCDFAFIDLFAGIGGFRLAFESVGGRCVWSSENDKFARQTYQANHRCAHPFAGDICDVDANDVPTHDVLCAGFPCQPFSVGGIAARRLHGLPEGFACKTRGTLFFEIARILDAKRPPAFLLENVNHLLHHNDGRTFEIIRHILADELGYHLQWRVVDAVAWVPQHRKRLFIVGFREPNFFSFGDLDIPNARHTLRNVLVPDDDVPAHYTLSNKKWAGKQAHKTRNAITHGNPGLGYRLVGPDDVSRTITTWVRNDVYVAQPGRNPRRYTPRECARLMGYPDSFEIPVSDSQAYRQFGNSVVVPCVAAIARLMAPYIKSGAKRRAHTVLPPDSVVGANYG